MRMLFHANDITETGTSTSIWEYASWFAARGHEVNIAYNTDYRTNHSSSIKKFESRFEVHGYAKFNSFAIEQAGKFDFAYFAKAGNFDGRLLPGAKNAVHAVFQHFEPHGDSYAYVSQWTADMMARDQQIYLPRSVRRKIPNKLMRLPDVPHFVNMPPMNRNLRKDWRIPEDAFVILRYGGYEKFDIKWVQRIVLELLNKYHNLFFIFINTKPFAIHKRIVYLPVIMEKQDKSNALYSADLFLHARMQGECFSMALLEAMSARIPILSWRGGIDQGHTLTLDADSLYDSPASLMVRLNSMITGARNRYDHRKLKEFSEDKVMNKFIKVFLGGL